MGSAGLFAHGALGNARLIAIQAASTFANAPAVSLWMWEWISAASCVQHNMHNATRPSRSRSRKAGIVDRRGASCKMLLHEASGGQWPAALA
ncbi:hypothetical protein J1614_009044 [Plenodomus biglobosus]|nr:hypothetical protein J1614_009044 [Plenodomus biglobosus]